MKLAREFNRPDWRNMLAGISSSELAEWGNFYRHQYFQCDLLDAHFSRLGHHIETMFCPSTEFTPHHFSLLAPHEQEDRDMEDDTMMSLAESLGGIRYGPASG